jgi:hypothetical protein
VSQTFTDAGFSQYDAAGGDNFAVKKTCKVTGVYVPGQYFNGTGPADSETLRSTPMMPVASRAR